MPSPRLAVLVACLLTVATGCSRSPAPAASKPHAAPVTLDGEHAASVPDADAPPELVGEFRIVSVVLGNAVDADNLVLAGREVFGRKDTLHASVLSVGASQGLRLSARWLAPDGQTVAETSQPLVPTAATATTFTLSNPKPWPVGDYQLVIAVNGHAEPAHSFQVR